MSTSIRLSSRVGFVRSIGITIAWVITLTMLVLNTPGKASATELVMVEARGCHYCEQWHRELGPIYPKTAESRIAPLRRIDISERDPENFEFARRVVFTPTFVLVHDGKEVGRMEGYLGDEFFWVVLQKMIVDAGLEGEAGF